VTISKNFEREFDYCARFSVINPPTRLLGFTFDVALPVSSQNPMLPVRRWQYTIVLIDLTLSVSRQSSRYGRLTATNGELENYEAYDP
jgi:hypothetical protein